MRVAGATGCAQGSEAELRDTCPWSGVRKTRISSLGTPDINSVDSPGTRKHALHDRAYFQPSEWLVSCQQNN